MWVKAIKLDQSFETLQYVGGYPCLSYHLSSPTRPVKDCTLNVTYALQITSEVEWISLEFALVEIPGL